MAIQNSLVEELVKEIRGHVVIHYVAGPRTGECECEICGVIWLANENSEPHANSCLIARANAVLASEP